MLDDAANGDAIRRREFDRFSTRLRRVRKAWGTEYAVGGIMKFVRSIAVFACLASLAGCSALGMGKQSSCTSTDAEQVIKDIVRENIEKGAASQLTLDDGTVISSRANLRASLAQIVMSIEDVRTAKEDPESTKRFCTGSLNVTVPVAALADAEKTFELLGQYDITTRADRNDIERTANKFAVDIDFNIQPTDDRKKIYGEVTDSASAITFFTDIVVAHLAKAGIEDASAMAARDQAEQVRLQNEALSQQRRAALDEAKTVSTLATQEMLAIWAGIPEDVQARLTANQTAWNAKKRADCTIEAAGVSTDAQEREASRLSCDARITRTRANDLSRFVGVPQSDGY